MTPSKSLPVDSNSLPSQAINDRISEAYYGAMGEDFARQTKQRVHWLAEQVRGRRVLDIGCSQGITTILLGREGIETLGLDISQSTIDTANAYLEREPETVREKVKFVSADFMVHDFGNDRFSTIILGEVIEHLIKPENFIEKSYNILDDNGKLIITVPFGINDFPDHKRTYYLTGIIKLASKYFIVEKVSYFGHWIGLTAERLPEPSEEKLENLNFREVERLEQAVFAQERQLRDRINEQMRSLSSERKKTENALTKLAKLEENVKQLSVEIASSKSENATLKDELAEGIAKIDAIQSENATLKDELAEKAGQLIELKTTLTRERQQIETLRSVHQSEISKIKNSATMKAGQILANGSRSFRGLVGLPIEFWRLFKAVRKADSLNSQNKGQNKRLPSNGESAETNLGSSLKPSEKKTPLIARPHNNRFAILRERTAGQKCSRQIAPAESVSLSNDPIWHDLEAVGPGTIELLLRPYTVGNFSEAKARVYLIALDNNNHALHGTADEPYATVRLVRDRTSITWSELPPETRRVRFGIASSDAAQLDTNVGYSVFPRGVSVVIPAYLARGHIERCLSSLAAQDLDATTFEAIIILNGPDDGTRSLVEKFCRANKCLTIRVLESEPASAGRARNLGIESAQFDHVILLDADDQISPRYLSSLLSQADSASIVIGNIWDVTDEACTKSHISEEIENARHRDSLTIFDLNSVCALNACKLSPTVYARHTHFRPDLKSGEDVVFWHELTMRFAPPAKISKFIENTIYLRYLTPDSLSRKAPNYDFMVTQRLDVITLLSSSLKEKDKKLQELTYSRINSQSSFIIEYISKNSEDYQKVIDEIRDRNIEYPLLSYINRKISDTIVISYCFPPANDTAGIVAAKRIRQNQVAVDVLSNTMTTVRGADLALENLVEDYVGENIKIDAPEKFANWNGIAEFCEKTRRAVDQLQRKRGRPYTQLYSRAMWPASHFAAAVVKARNPNIRWSAEFSDPILMDVHGRERSGEMDPKWLNDNGLALAIASIQPHVADLEDNRLFSWCELLPAIFADELVFTNPNQLKYMLSYRENGKLRDLIQKKAIIKPHPTLPEEFYSRSTYNYEFDSTKINFGYFGSFYETRGITEILNAISNLEDEHIGRIKFHIFTQNPEAVMESQVAKRLSQSISANPYVGYFDFLSLCRKFDYLYINDATCEGSHEMNPYLPSKLSDYLGANRPIFAHFEENSPMTRVKLPDGSVAVPLDEPHKAKDALMNIIRNERSK